MPVRALSIHCSRCNGRVVIHLENRALVAVCQTCGIRMPAKDAVQPSHPRLKGGK